MKKFWKIFIIIVVLLVWLVIIANVYDKYQKRKTVESSAFSILSYVENYSWSSEGEVLLKNWFLASYNECLEAARKDNIEINDNTKTSCIYMATLEYVWICSVATLDMSKATSWFWLSDFCMIEMKVIWENFVRLVKEYDYNYFNLKK